MQTVITPPETLAIEPCTHCQLHCPGCLNIVYARRMLTGEAPARDDIPCTRCTLYKKRPETGQFLTAAEVGQHASLQVRLHTRESELGATV